MNAEILHEALNNLDDDLIKGVDALRNSKRKKKLWVLWLPAAACLCLMIVSSVLPNGITDASEYIITDGLMSDLYCEDAESVVEQASSVTVATFVTLRITQFTDDGFVGAVTEDSRTDRWITGTVMTVRCGNVQAVTELAVGDAVTVTVSKIIASNIILAEKVERINNG